MWLQVYFLRTGCLQHIDKFVAMSSHYKVADLQVRMGQLVVMHGAVVSGAVAAVEGAVGGCGRGGWRLWKGQLAVVEGQLAGPSHR